MSVSKVTECIRVDRELLTKFLYKASPLPLVTVVSFWSELLPYKQEDAGKRSCLLAVTN